MFQKAFKVFQKGSNNFKGQFGMIHSTFQCLFHFCFAYICLFLDQPLRPVIHVQNTCIYLIMTQQSFFLIFNCCHTMQQCILNCSLMLLKLSDNQRFVSCLVHTYQDNMP